MRDSIDFTYEHKTGCPRCISEGRDNSRDNLHVYGEDADGGNRGARCFSCGYTLLSDEYKEEHGLNEVILEEYTFVSTDFNEDIHTKLKESTGVDSKGYRGIKMEISRSLGVRYQYSEEDGSVVKSFYPVTKDSLTLGVKDSIVGYKVRGHPKTFLPPIGEAKNDCDLFMQWKFPTHKGILIITGGEVDAMSAYQMLYENHVKRGGKDKGWDEVAVVSGITGEGGTAAQLKLQYNWLNNFSKIIICMDNDAAGRLATEQIAQILPKGKAFIMPLRLKDVNEYLEKGMDKEFISDFWGNKPFTPDGIKSSVDGFNEIEDELLRPRVTLPPYMHKMQSMMGGGIQQGRITNIIAATSAGKTTHVRECVKHWIFNTDLTPTIVSLEETAAQYNIGLLQSYLKDNLLWERSGKEVVELLKGEKYQKAIQELSYKPDGSPRYFLIDERSGDIKSIEKQMEEMYKKYGSKLFVIDVLSDLLRGSSADLAEDHMNFQKALVKEGCTIVNVLHTVKIPLGENGKPRNVTEYDALGSGSFVQSAHYNILLNRDKMEENSVLQNTTESSMPKCRGGKTGIAGHWYFDFNTQTCYDLDDWLSLNPHMDSSNKD